MGLTWGADLLPIELACVAILLLGLGLRARVGGFSAWRQDAGPVFAGALIAEDSCIRLYGFYEYAPGWHLWCDRVPVLVPIIWIFVVLSARDVARTLGACRAKVRRAPSPIFVYFRAKTARSEFGQFHATGSPHPRPALGSCSSKGQIWPFPDKLLGPRQGATWLGVALATIWYDASLIEPIATHVGLWRWHEAGPWAVPWLGMLGWALYGASALWWLGRLGSGARKWWTLLLAPLTTHALLLALWWGGLRWFARERPSDELAALGAWLVAAGLVVALGLRGRRAQLPLALVLPRIAPALFFFGLLGWVQAPWPLWAWAASFALPWLFAVQWRKGRPT